MDDSEPMFWPIARLLGAFRARELSPVEVARQALERVQRFDDRLHSYLTPTPDLALKQARQAEDLYRRPDGAPAALLGVPLSIKDLFDVRGEPTSLGSLVYQGTIAEGDSEPVARLRRAGAVFLGKTNTAEFGQSATTENLLTPGGRNPWDPGRTAGGSSGGAAASVGAGLAAVALGSDGGGSIRIPAAMCGVFGIKPTLDTADGNSSFRAMTDFVCPGPLARRVADARAVLGVLLGRSLATSVPPPPRRIAWCPAPEGHPVEPGVRAATARAVAILTELGHEVEEVPLPVDGWTEAFGPLVLADEWRYRRHLLRDGGEGLTEYARRTIEAAEQVTDREIDAARALKDEIRWRIEAMFDRYDLIVTPTTATVAFAIGQRPTVIDGHKVSGLWGPFPFTAPFNVAGIPAASIPVALSEGLPVGLQVVGRPGGEGAILDLCEQLESAVSFPAGEMVERWRSPADAASSRVSADPQPELVIEHRQSVAIFRLNRPAKRNALTMTMLERIQRALREEADNGTAAVILTGGDAVFSAGMDLGELGKGTADVAVDEMIAATAATIRELPIPVLAAIEGPCFGAALDIALACDVRVGGEGASFGIPAVRLGALYRPQGIAEMVGALGRETAARLLLLGDRVPADEAASAGVISRLVARRGALDAAVELALANAGAPHEAVSATKQLINHVARVSSDDLAGWEVVRRELLTSDARRRSLTEARARLSANTTIDLTP